MPNLQGLDFESIAERVLHEINGINTSFPRLSHPTDSSLRVIVYLFFTMIGVGIICGIIYVCQKVSKIS
jgi:hypothetical protein